MAPTAHNLQATKPQRVPDATNATSVNRTATATVSHVDFPATVDVIDQATAVPQFGNLAPPSAGPTSGSAGIAASATVVDRGPDTFANNFPAHDRYSSLSAQDQGIPIRQFWEEKCAHSTAQRAPSPNVTIHATPVPLHQPQAVQSRTKSQPGVVPPPRPGVSQGGQERRRGHQQEGQREP